MGGGGSTCNNGSCNEINININAPGGPGQPGLGGSDYWQYNPEAGVVEITIAYGNVIDSIQFKNANGNSTAQKFGGEGGTKTASFKINWPHEYVTRISGNNVVYNGAEVVGSLTFYTNLNGEHKFDGSIKNNAKPFEFSEKDQAIVGLYGKKGTYISSLGVQYDDIPASTVTTKVN